jgi:HlyD family secretion protein
VAAARAALLDADPAGSTGRAVALVRAPVGGRVLRVHEPSERIVAAGTPLVQLGDAGGLEVVVDVLSTDAVRIQPGAPMRLVEWGGEGAIAARVRLVEPSGFTKVSTLGVEEQRVNVIGDLLDPPAVLGDGYRVEARIVTWAADDVLRVPNSALFRTGGGWSLFVEQEGRARLREVRVGHRGASEAEVLDGLAEGEQVILFPSEQIRDGVRVRPSQR